MTASTETEPNPCFDDSRRLTGPNRYYASTAAILDTRGTRANDAGAHARWREHVIALCTALGWNIAPPMVQRHASGTILVIAAPWDQLLTATEVNEWAWEMASGYFAADHTGDQFDRLHPYDDLARAAATFRAIADAECNPALAALRDAAHKHGLPVFIDDSLEDANVSVGAGHLSRTWPVASLPSLNDIAWNALGDIRKALVTGSNGKTTTVRLIAAMLDASGEKVGYSSTEGVVIDRESIGGGDYSGPAGARLVLRDPRVTAAVLETARGGILRRGLAVAHADVAVVTNISADHFGEYGIDSNDDLADVKLVVARALDANGTLVLNADDPVLLPRAAQQTCKVALFAQHDDHPALAAHREQGGSTCGTRDGKIFLSHDGMRTALGNIDDMPLTLNGSARYNIANLMAAALAASAMKVNVKTIIEVMARFGNDRQDNPGRLQRWHVGGINVLIDYAHNPDGLEGLMKVAASLKGKRVGLLLGQAGNRSDDAIHDLAQTAAASRPARIALKELPTMLRGRMRGEVPALLHSALVAAGFSASSISAASDEIDAARALLAWAEAGDVIVLPIHQTASRAEISQLLDRLVAAGWRAGQSMP